MMHRGMVVGCVLLFSGSPLVAVPVQAGQFTVGTLAYSWLADGTQNIYIQGSLSDRSAWFFDKCNSDGDTLTAWYKRYRNKVSHGPYWFVSAIYITQGNRKGYSGAAGVGYEYTTRNNFTFGGYAGGAAGGDNNVTYAVANLTVGYTFQ
ncbi:MAG: hypothetical protein R3188_03735 [Acidiferrobacterales bacterium]|nr:hypothetical protein [Acidiferrobacterales bacterium]